LETERTADAPGQQQLTEQGREAVGHAEGQPSRISAPQTGSNGEWVGSTGRRGASPAPSAAAAPPAACPTAKGGWRRRRRAPARCVAQHSTGKPIASETSQRRRSGCTIAGRLLTLCSHPNTATVCSKKHNPGRRQYASTLNAACRALQGSHLMASPAKKKAPRRASIRTPAGSPRRPSAPMPLARAVPLPLLPLPHASEASSLCTGMPNGSG
jgi:hypothetical protein